MACRWVQEDLVNSKSARVISITGSSLTTRTKPPYWAVTVETKKINGEGGESTSHKAQKNLTIQNLTVEGALELRS